LLVYGVLGLPALLGVAGLGIYARSNEKKLLLASLGDAANRGLLPAADVLWLADLRGRRHARHQAKQLGGEQGLQAMRDYQRAAVELGFLHNRFMRGVAPADYQDRGAHYVTEIRAIRPFLSFGSQHTGAPTR